MSLDRVIHSDNFTDEYGELHYFNTGRDNISGLNFPNHYVRNANNYSYVRILNIKLSPDTSLIYPIHETFLLTTYKNDNTHGMTNIINIEGLAKAGTLNANDLKITCVPLNYTTDIYNNKVHDIRATLKSELDINGNVAMSLSIWLYAKDMIDIIIKDLTSLSYNEIPNNIYRQFLQCNYESHYLNNEDIIEGTNMVNSENNVGSIIVRSKNINEVLINKIKTIDSNVQSATPDYQYLTVIYDDMYTISNINTDEIIKPTAFKYIEVDNAFATIKDNYVQVNEAGNYIIALKVDMDTNAGATKMMMSLFLNDDRIEETTCTLYLDSSNKVYPLGFLAGQAKITLKPSDKLYLKTRWTEKTNVDLENHCTLQIIKLNKL